MSFGVRRLAAAFQAAGLPAAGAMFRHQSGSNLSHSKARAHVPLRLLKDQRFSNP